MKRRRPRQALVQHAGERVTVGAGVDVLTADLLRGDVVERPHYLPGLGRVAAELLGDPEVRQVRVAVLVDEHVGGLDVAMHEPAPVRGVERARDLGEDVERALGRQPALPAQQRSHVAAVDEAHREVQLPVVLAGLIDRDDVRMVQGGGKARLLEEAAPEQLVPGQLGRDQLQRHRALEREVGRPVDNAHAAATDHRLDLVAGEARAAVQGDAHDPAPVSRSVATTSFARSSRIAGNERCLTPPSAAAMFCSATSSGPRSLNCMRFRADRTGPQLPASTAHLPDRLPGSSNVRPRRPHRAVSSEER